MEVQYLFSRPNNKAKMGAAVISWASKVVRKHDGEVPSHVAVLLNGNLVVESTFTTGVRIIPYSNWLKKNKLIKQIPCAQPYRSSKEVFSLLMDVWGKKYDWKGILFFSWCIVKKILLGEKIPRVNKWEDKNSYFCTEFAARLTGVESGMLTPLEFMIKLEG